MFSPSPRRSSFPQNDYNNSTSNSSNNNQKTPPQTLAANLHSIPRPISTLDPKRSSRQNGRSRRKNTAIQRQELLSQSTQLLPPPLSSSPPSSVNQNHPTPDHHDHYNGSSSTEEEDNVVDPSINVTGSPSPNMSPKKKNNKPKDSQHHKILLNWSAKRKSYTHDIAKWPLMIIMLICCVIDLAIYFSIRNFVSWWEDLVVWTGRKGQLHKQIHNAKACKEWETSAKLLDQLMGNEEWKHEATSSLYDYQLINKIVRRLKRYRTNCLKKNPSPSTEEISIMTHEIRRLLLHSACKANIGGVENEQLYCRSYYGTKILIDEFVNEVIQSLDFIAESKILTVDEKLGFLKNASRTYGKTALCLSGGAAMGYYSIGVSKALHELNLLPNVITGTSAGSLIAAIICTRTDQELKDEVFNIDLQKRLTLITDSGGDWTAIINRYWKTGAMFDPNNAIPGLTWASKDLTFLEAYKRTGRILNISVCAAEPRSPPKLLNYVTAPDVLISSAVLASAAIPGFFHPVQLLMKNPEHPNQHVPFRGAGKRWKDGSINSDIPERELHQLFNINYTIVSQCNPHIVVFFYQGQGSPGNPTPHRLGTGWRGGFLASAIIQHFKLDLQKWLRLLRDLHLTPTILGTDLSKLFLQRFEGSITLLPQFILNDYFHLLSDPNKERMKRYLEIGQSTCWAKCKMIANRVGIERKLRELIRRIKREGEGARVGLNLETRNLGNFVQESDSEDD